MPSLIKHLCHILTARLNYKPACELQTRFIKSYERFNSPLIVRNIFLQTANFNENCSAKQNKRWAHSTATATVEKPQQLQIRPHKKRITIEPLVAPMEEGSYITLAYATAAEYDLEGLKNDLNNQKLYTVSKLSWPDSPDVLQALASYQVSSEKREIYFFREGAAVFWNCSEVEAENVLATVKKYEIGAYNKNDVKEERELMLYKYQPPGKTCQLEEDWGFLLTDTSNDTVSSTLEKFTFSNAVSQSVKLGVWERSLSRLAEDVQSISKDMAAGNRLKITRQGAAQLSGQLFDLRTQINLESDLLDTPDFYWEHHNLERLYGRTVAFFSIARRTQVLNKRLEHCVELIELLSSWLSDKHHIRLEWMIIVLIMVEVGFETLHYMERHML